METNDNVEDNCMFGLVVNPRTGLLHPAFRRTEIEVIISDLAGWMTGSGRRTVEGKLGLGTFNKSDDYEIPSIVSGLPRVHTPDGVKGRGVGLGTVLYTALCFAAHLSNRKLILFDTGDYSGDGICSGNGRSSYADNWWSNAKTKYGLAFEKAAIIPMEIETRWDDEGSRYANKYVSDFVLQRKNVKVNEVSQVDLKVSATYTFEEHVSADVYPFSSAKKSNLIVAWFYHPDHYLRGVRGSDPNEWKEVNVPALVNANLSDLNPQDPDHVDTAFRLMTAAKAHGASQKEVDFMLERFREGIDVEMRPDPRDPAFVEEQTKYSVRAAAGILLPGKTLASGISRRRTPRRMRLTAISPSGTVTQRQSTQLLQLAEARKKLGWDAFSEDD